MPSIGFTPYEFLNLIILAFLLGFGWSAGCWLWSVIVSALNRGKAP